MPDQPRVHVCIHGHYYQPPRENPWLEAVEVQDSAAPDHDWNARITRECYAPNSRARLVDGEGKIVQLLNNYAWMSYNFGPTLLAWMAEETPHVLAGIVEGDRLSRERRGGHGNAMAQVYNHVIMPLASAHDKRTQVLWGIADFRARFGREPEGMWLAETAADVASLEALADAGIRFTVLAPRQAKRWRKIGDEKWEEGGIDPSRAYLCRLPSGNQITLFFYDGAISQAVAFEKLLSSGEKFLERLKKGIDPARPHPQLVHIATDGESYGHHHAHGDMALAFVLERLNKDPEIKLTNYGEFLEANPPEWEAEIHDNSSWSCVHGVERWRSNCGCNSGRGWQQEWRGPLRQAFDHLKGKLDELFHGEGKSLLKDPGQARDEYIDVVLDRSPESIDRFFAKHGQQNLDDEGKRKALWLLEMQRHGLLMYTSCGWFFDEISGLETTQCLRYAARAIQLARHFDRDFEQEFVAILEQAPSNLPEHQNGRVVWEKFVRPDPVNLDRVLAHYAISLIWRERQDTDRVYCYDLETRDLRVEGRGNTHVAMGHLHVRSRLTANEADTCFIVVHFGGLDFHAALRKAPEPAEYEAIKQKLFQLYETGSLADVTAMVVDDFKGEVHRLSDLFVEEQRRVIGIVLQDRFADYQQSFERLSDVDEDVLFQLGRLHYPIPKAMRAAATLTFDRRILHEIERLDNEDGLRRIEHLTERGKAWGYQPDRDLIAQALKRSLESVVAEVKPGADPAQLAAHGIRHLDAAARLGITLDLWHAQNVMLDAVAQMPDLDATWRKSLAGLADRLGIRPQLLGWEP